MIVVEVRGACDPSPCAPLPNGNGEKISGQRVGFLGGVVDDYLQIYIPSAPPENAMTKAEVIQKYGEIEDWDVSRVTNMESLFNAYINVGSSSARSSVNNDISKWDVHNVTQMMNMFMGARSFNIDLSAWRVDKVSNMDEMFHSAVSFNRTLCGNTWVHAKAYKGNHMFYKSGGGRIASTICSCSPGKYITVTSPITCQSCPIGKYQDEQGYTGTLCTKKCQPGKYSNVEEAGALACIECVAGHYSDSGEAQTSRDTCKACPAGLYSSEEGQSNRAACNIETHPLPDGTGCQSCTPTSLGGVVNDWLNPSKRNSIEAKYGIIENWDTSQVTNMASVFFDKKAFNGDISKWQVHNITTLQLTFCDANSFNIDISKWSVNKVTDMSRTFRSAEKFNQDLSKWNVRNVVTMWKMFWLSSDFTQTLCGNTWVDANKKNSKVGKVHMFLDTGGGAIASEPCSCSPGKYYISGTPKMCNHCPVGKYQDEDGHNQTSCTKSLTCSAGEYAKEGAKNVHDCTTCSAGRYSDTGPGQTSPNTCKACAAGRYSTSGEGQISIDVCHHSCSPGKWSKQEALTSDESCTKCSPGRYSTSGEGQISIDVCRHLCSPGKFSNEEGLMSDQDCSLCPEGTFATQPGLASLNDCKICGDGEYADSLGSKRCKACPLGRYMNINNEDSKTNPQQHDQLLNCLICKSDHFQDQLGQTDCKSCPSGSGKLISDDANDPTKHERENQCIIKGGVESCSSGHGSSANSNGECDPCSAGTYSSKDGVRCVLCPTGYYQDEAAQEDCTECIDNICTGSTFMPGATSKTDSLQPASLSLEFAFAFAQDNYTDKSNRAVAFGAVSTNIGGSQEVTDETDGLEYGMSTAFIVLLGLIAFALVLFHRYLPMGFKEADLLFAGDHFIDDTVSMPHFFFPFSFNHSRNTVEQHLTTIVFVNLYFFFPFF